MEFERARVFQILRRRHRRSVERFVALGDERLLPAEPFDLPEAQAEQQQETQRRPEGGPEQPPFHGFASRPKARWRYCSAISPAFIGLSSRMEPASVTGVHSAICTQSGGENRISSRMAPRTTKAPRMSTTNTAGPSPASSAARSSPQTEQREATFNSPSNSLPRPQRGQRQANAAT